MRMNAPVRRIYVLVAAAMLLGAGWAKKVDGRKVKNLHEVTPTLFRGAQPDAKGIQTLKSLGIKTIVNLRALHSDKKLVAGTGLDLVEIDFEPWKGPKRADLLDFLKVVTDPARCPCYVHCKHGSDRTGTAVAAYRMVVQRWDKEEAIREMQDGGFGFHGKVYKHVLNYPEFLRKLDENKLREELGLNGRPDQRGPTKSE